jgi:hypothetical protein
MSTIELTAAKEVKGDDNLGFGIVVMFLLVLSLPLLLDTYSHATDSRNTAVAMSATVAIAVIVIESTRMP